MKHIVGKFLIEWGVVTSDTSLSLWTSYADRVLVDIDGYGGTATTTGVIADVIKKVEAPARTAVYYDPYHNTCYAEDYSPESYRCNDAANGLILGFLKGDIKRSSFTYKCHCTALASPFKPLSLDHTDSLTVVIGHKRQHHREYYDDVMRISLHTTAESETCKYKGQTLTWNSLTRRCYYKIATGTYKTTNIRGKNTIYYEL
jgi:hypothetical protein